jgi:predicted enzyme related to lactoylglutathione lyase
MAAADRTANRHPGVMFEIIARDQAAMMAFYEKLFGWHYRAGTDGFAYIRFPAGRQKLLGGIGRADPATPGFEPGHNFYLLVDRLEPVIALAVGNGGQAHMPPTAVDGYRFAMIKDPEGNPVGLIEPFGKGA